MENNIYKAPESQLTSTSDNQPELASRISRLLASLIDGLTIALVTLPPLAGQIFSIVNILFIFGAQRRCIHDFAAGTKVVSCG